MAEALSTDGTATPVLVAASEPSDMAFMHLAMEQAGLAGDLGEVPVGAIVVSAQGEVIGRGHNRTIIDADPTAHAEIVALRMAGQALSNYRMPGVSVYVTLEPCIMCMGAMLHARVGRVVFGASDPKTGACGSVVDVSAITQINHHTTVAGGVMAEPCGHLLRQFFRARRAKDKSV